MAESPAGGKVAVAGAGAAGRSLHDAAGAVTPRIALQVDRLAPLAVGTFELQLSAAPAVPRHGPHRSALAGRPGFASRPALAGLAVTTRSTGQPTRPRFASSSVTTWRAGLASRAWLAWRPVFAIAARSAVGAVLAIASVASITAAESRALRLRRLLERFVG